MRVPAYLMREEITVKPLLGSSAYGPQYGPEYKTRCRMEPRRKRLEDLAAGDMRSVTRTVNEFKAFLPPDRDLIIGSIVTWKGRQLVVKDAFTRVGLLPSHIEAVLV